MLIRITNLQSTHSLLVSSLLVLSLMPKEENERDQERGEGKMNRRAGEKVILNVYDLNEQNDFLYPLGLGMYHSGVEVHGT